MDTEAAQLIIAKLLMETAIARQKALITGSNLKTNRLALVSGIADAFNVNGVPASAISAEVMIDKSKISNLVALKFGSPCQFMDIQGNVGWDCILDHALSHTQLRITNTTTTQMSMKTYSSQQCKDSLWPVESSRLDEWIAEDALFIAHQLIDLTTEACTEQTPRPRF